MQSYNLASRPCTTCRSIQGRTVCNYVGCLVKFTDKGTFGSQILLVAGSQNIFRQYPGRNQTLRPFVISLHISPVGYVKLRRWTKSVLIWSKGPVESIEYQTEHFEMKPTGMLSMQATCRVRCGVKAI